MHILLAILLFFFVILILVFSILKGVVSFLFRGFSSKNKNTQQEYRNNTSSQTYSNKETDKVFSSDEGEYVKYEEVE